LPQTFQDKCKLVATKRKRVCQCPGLHRRTCGEIAVLRNKQNLTLNIDEFQMSKTSKSCCVASMSDASVQFLRSFHTFSFLSPTESVLVISNIASSSDYLSLSLSPFSSFSPHLKWPQFIFYFGRISKSCLALIFSDVLRVR
jgi:hypothetical protein